MISTSRVTLLVLASRHGRDNFACHFSPFWTGVLLLVLGLAGHPSVALRETLSDVALTADSSCLVDTVLGGTNRLYLLDVANCLGGDVDGFVNIELVVSQPTAQNLSTFTTPPFSLVVHTEGKLPVFNVTSYGSRSSGTLFATLDDESGDHQNNMNLTLPLSEYNKAFPWYVSVSAYAEDLSFFLRAWCTGNKDCAQSCDGESKRCVGVGTCRCIVSPSHSSCDIDVALLTSQFSGEDGQLVAKEIGLLDAGKWNYYSFETNESESRVLVELSREHGDLALFLKPKGINNTEALPSETDFRTYADVSGFRNLLSDQYIFWSGADSFYIGVFNNGACVQESASYTLTVKMAPPHSKMNLCPFNCSFPQGKCVRDAVCECHDGYGGMFCESAIRTAELFEPFSGHLLPGETAYYDINLEDVAGSNCLSIQFTRGGGYPILLGLAGGYPTLINNTVKSSGGPPGPNTTSTYSIENVRSDNESYILAIFNADYIVRSDSTFEVVILLIESDSAKKALKPTLIILVGFLSSLFACVAMGLVKLIVHRWNGGEVAQTYDQDTIESVPDVTFARQGLEKSVVESFPLVTFKENSEELKVTQCPICLSEYMDSDRLRVIPLCAHAFHVGCADKWLQDHANCPVCRVVLGPSMTQANSSVEPTDSLPQDIT